jgi:hypothetical protein
MDILAETLQKLSARRGLVARELATLDEAIDALQRVRDEAPKHGTAAALPGPVSVPPSKSAPAAAPAHRQVLCALASCGQPVPAMPPTGGRPRMYCSKSCNKKATRLRARPAPAAPVDDEDPTDRALRQHRELHPVPESASGMRARAKGRA